MPIGCIKNASNHPKKCPLIIITLWSITWHPSSILHVERKRADLTSSSFFIEKSEQNRRFKRPPTPKLITLFFFDFIFEIWVHFFVQFIKKPLVFVVRSPPFLLYPFSWYLIGRLGSPKRTVTLRLNKSPSVSGPWYTAGTIFAFRHSKSTPSRL